MRYFELLKKRAIERQNYIKNFDQYLQIIKKFFQEKLGEVEVYLFGSFLTSDFGPESDIDILIISPNTPQKSFQRSKLIAQLKNKIGFWNPFEIHLITPEEYKEWYSHFIKKKKKV
ncbi:MAG: nucleotidyltransferase domain-containing protein [Candidatus Pacebacteria bacterium]|nr:nucleotidyltransferase domain-containing protein [Candidatus Paceibacterota bacterium]